MNKLNPLFLLILMLGYAGCDGNEPVTKESITSSVTEISTGYEQHISTINVTASREWMAYSNESWITCNPSSFITTTGTVTVTISANASQQPREGSVILKAGSERVTIPVTQERGPESEITGPEGYTLVWNDEFDEGNQPNTAEWWYETGGHGWGNNELQNYVTGSQGGEQLAKIENGILTITAKKIGGTVYSIRMNTTKSWTYGYFEARLKVPVGKGTWPAFWMMPQNFNAWPDDGEIDIMEHVGYNPNVIHSSIHCKAYYHSIGTQKTGTRSVPTAQTEFHVYAVEWTPDFIKGYVDGVNYFTFLNDKTNNYNTWPFFNPFYLKLNLAWGGDWGGAQGIDESFLPANYQIDYVRVFQKQ
ncbi:MAG: family 16 glycosylhydrolase [Cyclobacteriaceae bacterium]|nr:family 16 glycosylhydrolase [Cyclobacteriaceae bacterium]